jgi:L-alanine-DL-glutamate epimerase-like enolase superfamily enzyme
MNRREFLSFCGAVAGGAAFPQAGWAAGLPQDIRITRMIGFDLVSQRAKFCGKNSRLDDHGDQARDRMVRIFTNAGLDGIGNCRAGEAELSSLLGRSPFDFFNRDEPAMRGPLGAGTMPLWDLAGKALKKPVYQLLGGKGPRHVPAYDGSIYFSDLLTQYANRWQDRFKEEIDLGLKRGHRAFKIKIGRGSKWMPADAGYARDKEVLQLIRRHAGPNIVLGADANDGYSLELVKQLLSDLPEIRLAFLEEMFPENIDQYRELKAFLRTHKLKTLIADGETQSKIEGLKPFIEARVFDVYQADMNRFGVEGILQEAAAVGPRGFIGPHNWGSLVGFYMILHMGRAIKNFYYAENDPLDSDVLIAEGYAIKDGRVTVPDAPGFGLKIDEKIFAATIKPRFDLRP